MIGKVAAVFLKRKELAEVESATSFWSNFEWLAISWLVQVFLGLGPPTLKNDFVTLGSDFFFARGPFGGGRVACERRPTTLVSPCTWP